MEFIFLIGLFFLLTFFMPWVNHSRFGSVRKEIASLRSRIEELEKRIFDDKPASVKPSNQKPIVIQEGFGRHVSRADKTEWEKRAKNKKEITEDSLFESNTESEAANPSYETQSSVPPARAEKIDWAKKAHSTFEQNVATKLPVWVGSISLIFAAFFLVKYSIEFGWLGPIARVSLGAFFGASLLAAGQFVSKRLEMANAIRISQGLIGAGIVALYVSLYAAINLYNFLPPLFGFVGMATVTALAVVLSLRHGQPIAVFGLLGGLLTPALIGSDEPNALALFTYLFLLFSGIFVVLIRMGWWVLAILALIGVFGWSAIWFTFTFAASDAFVLVLFTMALTAIVLAATGQRIAKGTLGDHEQYAVHFLNAIAIAGGVTTIIWLSLEIQLGLFDWSLLGLLSLALMTLTYFKPSIYQIPLFAKLGTSLILFFIWAKSAQLGDALVVLSGMAAVYIGGSAFIMRQVNDPRAWAALQSIAALSLFLISYWVLDLPLWFTEPVQMFWGMLSLALASLAIYQATDFKKKYTGHDVIQEHLMTIYGLTACAFISIGLAIELPSSYLPLAFAGQITATAWIYQRTRILFLRIVMYILTLVFVALNYEQALLFGRVIFESLFGEMPPARSISSFVLDAPLIKLGLPCVLFYLSFWMTMRIDKTNRELMNALFGTANILALFTAYYVFRDVSHSGTGHIFSSEASFVERGIITITLASVGMGIIEFIRKHDIEFLKPWGVGIFRMAILRFVYFDFFLHNPYWSRDQFVGDMPFFNGVTLTYGVGLLAIGWAICNEDLIARTSFLRKTYRAIGLASLFALITLTVRQYFHGGFLAQGSMSSAELYAYSVAWLVTGLAMLTAGIKLKNKTLRMSSLAFIILAVLKVFLFDAAELEGFYRVFSFLGLGISLIGLSYFYTRFVSAADKQRKE